MGAVNLGFSWWVARRVPLASAAITWRESLRESRLLVSLGSAFMWCGVLAAGVALATRAWIVRDFGPQANGIYQAAWAISGVFAGFILQAMGADFYPRLTAAAKDNSDVNRLANEQTEAGILLALPGLLATLVFAPWAIRLFYTGKFLEASELLPWFVLGIFGKVVSWPLAYIQAAKGNSRLYATSETAAMAMLLLLTWLGLRWLQVPGVAVAYALLVGIYAVQVRWIAGWLTGFRWSSSARRLVLESAAAVMLAFGIPKLLPPVAAAAAGGLLVLVASYLCLCRLTVCLGPSHRISRLVARFCTVRGTGAN
jgi:PST family polysaccharide transporter